MKYPVKLENLKEGVILFEGDAEVEQTEGKGLKISMQSGSFHSDWFVLSRGLLIKNMEEDLETVLTIRDRGKSKAVVHTVIGRLDLPLEHVKTEIFYDRIEVFYSLEGSEDSFSFRLSGLDGFGPVYVCNLHKKEEEL